MILRFKVKKKIIQKIRKFKLVKLLHNWYNIIHLVFLLFKPFGIYFLNEISAKAYNWPLDGLFLCQPIKSDSSAKINLLSFIYGFSFSESLFVTESSSSDKMSFAINTNEDEDDFTPSTK